MRYKLAHRPRGVVDAARVIVDASTARVALDQMRGEIPDDHVILYVKSAPDDAPAPY